MKNHNLYPNRSIPFFEVNGTAFPEVNATSSHKYECGRGHGRARVVAGSVVVVVIISMF